MPSIDMPLEKLREYQPPLYRESDFEEYWRTTVAAAGRHPEDGCQGQDAKATWKRGMIGHGCHCLPPQRRQLPAFAIDIKTNCCFRF